MSEELEDGFFDGSADEEEEVLPQESIDSIGEWLDIGGICFYIRKEHMAVLIGELEGLLVKKRRMPDLTLKLGRTELKRFELLRTDIQELRIKLINTCMERGWYFSASKEEV